MARFGGDEFVIAVPHVEIAIVDCIARRLTEAIAALRWGSELPVHVEASIGIASSRLLDMPTLAQLLAVADRDMYKNKWIREHPDERPELYEYPSDTRHETERLLPLGKPHRAP